MSHHRHLLTPAELYYSSGYLYIALSKRRLARFPLQSRGCTRSALNRGGAQRSKLHAGPPLLFLVLRLTGLDRAVCS
jgi:hypothetical protein